MSLIQTRLITQIMQLRPLQAASSLLAAISGGYQFFVDVADGHFKVRRPDGTTYDFMSGGGTGAANFVLFDTVPATAVYTFPELIGKTIGMARQDQQILNDTPGGVQDYTFNSATGAITLTTVPNGISKCTFFYK